jgi:hypothetical protein
MTGLRWMALVFVVLGVATVGLGIYDVQRPHGTLGYVQFAIAAAWFLVAWLNWTRANRFP